MCFREGYLLQKKKRKKESVHVVKNTLESIFKDPSCTSSAGPTLQTPCHVTKGAGTPPRLAKEMVFDFRRAPPSFTASGH